MIFFFIALAHSKKDELISFLHKYIDASASYLIGMETAPDSHVETKGEHFHICADMSLKQYDSFRKSVCVNHYALRGQVKKDQPKQYGRTLKVRDPARFMAYSLKDKNFISRGVSLEELDKLIKVSFPRPESFYDRIMTHLAENFEFEDTSSWSYDDIERMELIILNFHMDNAHALCKSKLKAYKDHFLQLKAPCRHITQNQQFIIYQLKL